MDTQFKNKNILINEGFKMNKVHPEIMKTLISKREEYSTFDITTRISGQIINPILHDVVRVERKIKGKTYIACILVNTSEYTVRPSQLVNNEVLAPANLVDETAVSKLKEVFGEKILVPIYSTLEELSTSIDCAYNTIGVHASGGMELTNLQRGNIQTTIKFNPVSNILDVSLANGNGEVITGNIRGKELRFKAHLNNIRTYNKSGAVMSLQLVIKDDYESNLSTIGDLFYAITTKFGDLRNIAARSKTDYGYLLPLLNKQFPAEKILGDLPAINALFTSTIVSIDLKAFSTNASIKKILTLAFSGRDVYRNILIKKLHAAFGFPANYPKEDIFLIGQIQPWGKLDNGKPIEELSLAEVAKETSDEAVISAFLSGNFKNSMEFLKLYNEFARVEGSLLRITFTSKFIRTLNETFRNNGYLNTERLVTHQTREQFAGVDISKADNLDYQTTGSTGGGSTSGNFIMT